MIDRRLLGDLSLAILLTLPLLALARPDMPAQRSEAAPAAAKLTVADRLPGEGRISLLG